MGSDARPHGVFVGLATLDVAQHVERAPRPDEKVTATATFLSGGGPAANAAVTFAALGGRAVLVTALGATPTAQLVRTELEQAGVEVVDVTPTSTAPPPVSAVTVVTTTGERSVVGSDAVTASTPPPADLAQHLADADVLLVDGHHPLLGVAAARTARAAGVPVVVDVGRWKPVMAELLPHADAMVCSADVRVPGSATPLESAALLRREVRDVVVTRGGASVLWWSGDGGGDAPARSGEVAVPAVTAVDSLGAGDAFHGAYAFATAVGGDVEAAVHLGVAVASVRVQHAGPRDWARHLPPGLGDPAATPGDPASPTHPAPPLQELS